MATSSEALLEAKLFRRGGELLFEMRFSHPRSAMLMLPFSFVITPNGCEFDKRYCCTDRNMRVAAKDLKWVSDGDYPHYALILNGRTNVLDNAEVVVDTLVNGKKFSSMTVLSQDVFE